MTHEDGLIITLETLDVRKYYRDRELETLNHLKAVLGVRNIYVPGSGFDSLPREVFGENCINGTLTESPHYFSRNRQDVIADYRFNPFPDGYFDAVYLHMLVGQDSLYDGLDDITRVIRDGGYLVWIDDTYYHRQDRYLDKLKEKGFFEATPSVLRQPIREYYQAKTELTGGHRTVILRK